MPSLFALQALVLFNWKIFPVFLEVLWRWSGRATLMLILAWWERSLVMLEVLILNFFSCVELEKQAHHHWSS